MEFGHCGLTTDIRQFSIQLRAFFVVSALLMTTPVTAQTEHSEAELPSNTPFSSMSMTLVKSLLFVRVDVLDLEVHFGIETTDRLEAIAQGRNLTPPIADSIAETAIQARDAYIRLRFLRNIDLNRFLKGAKENAKKVYEAGMITREAYQEIVEEFPGWYSGLEERGIQKDDLMLYRVRGDGLQTIFRGNDGRVYLDQQGQGEERRLALLGSYFAPKSDFRESLIRSLFLPSISQSQSGDRK